jgi:peptide/nickel transport system ATP-binding protein
MLQRVMIACAVACEPDLVVADEATTALDVTTQAEVVELLRSLKREHGVSVLFVSHDLAVVAELCDRVVVFYAGEVVEIGTKDEIVGSPRHPYTEALLKVSALASGDRGALDVIPGQPPAIDEHRIGCRFAGRCPYEVERCSSTSVALRQVAPGRWSRCLRSDEHLVGGSASR